MGFPCCVFEDCSGYPECGCRGGNGVDREQAVDILEEAYQEGSYLDWVRLAKEVGDVSSSVGIRALRSCLLQRDLSN